MTQAPLCHLFHPEFALSDLEQNTGISILVEFAFLEKDKIKLFLLNFSSQHKSLQRMVCACGVVRNGSFLGHLILLFNASIFLFFYYVLDNLGSCSIMCQHPWDKLHAYSERFISTTWWSPVIPHHWAPCLLKTLSVLTREELIIYIALLENNILPSGDSLVEQRYCLGSCLEFSQ